MLRSQSGGLVHALALDEYLFIKFTAVIWYIFIMEKDALEIIIILQDAGYEAYFAGGYVRDKLLGLESHDIDIVTSAEPEKIEKLFDKTVPIAKKFGIIFVVLSAKNYEVATFRKEAGYLDARRPSEVHFTNAKEDATRRDFTINGLFYDPIAKKTIDFVGGVEDIKKKTIRFIGNANERIEEDNLRLMRAIRFKIVLGFQYEDATFKSVRVNANLIKNVSSERIRDELNKILICQNRHIGLVELSESGLLGFVIPELEKLKGVPQPIEYHHEGDCFTHTYLALKSLPKDAPLHLSWAVLLHDIAKPQTLIKEDGKIIFHDHAQISAEVAKKILERLKFSRVEINDICWLIENHMKIGDIDKMRPGKAYEFLLDSKFSDLIELARSDALGTYPQNTHLVEGLEKKLTQAREHKNKLVSNARKDLITGDDLIKFGFKPGKKFKEILDNIRDQVLQGKIINKDAAKSYILENYKK